MSLQLLVLPPSTSLPGPRLLQLWMSQRTRLPPQPLLANTQSFTVTQEETATATADVTISTTQSTTFDVTDVLTVTSTSSLTVTVPTIVETTVTSTISVTNTDLVTTVVDVTATQTTSTTKTVTATATATCGANIVTNPNFDVNNAYSLSGWTTSGTGSMITHSTGSSIPATYVIWYGGSSPETYSLSQSLATYPGTTYTVSF